MDYTWNRVVHAFLKSFSDKPGQLGWKSFLETRKVRLAFEFL